MHVSLDYGTHILPFLAFYLAFKIVFHNLCMGRGAIMLAGDELNRPQAPRRQHCACDLPEVQEPIDCSAGRGSLDVSYAMGAGLYYGATYTRCSTP